MVHLGSCMGSGATGGIMSYSYAASIVPMVGMLSFNVDLGTGVLTEGVSTGIEGMTYPTTDTIFGVMQGTGTGTMNLYFES